LQGTGVLLGYADVWQFTPDFYERLKVGVIDEESIHEHDIL
jgi:GTP cyclohydrolase FolE2